LGPSVIGAHVAPFIPPERDRASPSRSLCELCDLIVSLNAFFLPSPFFHLLSCLILGLTPPPPAKLSEPSLARTVFAKFILPGFCVSDLYPLSLEPCFIVFLILLDLLLQPLFPLPFQDRQGSSFLRASMCRPTHK